MPIINPEDFLSRDLTLDVRLETCVDGQYIDFTGKKSYNFGLFRENIGFGITNINIEVNPSLQPIIEIEFKDLYGNTLFGTQRVGASEAFLTPGLKAGDIDYSIIFNWPPPKFYFTFKGYLGKSVTWILNLKKVTTGYDSSDSSYTLKASFVPNQWGFFADIPFLFLLGIKGLKKKSSNPQDNNDNNQIQTIFDYIKTGKRVDSKTIEYTKIFDTLKKQVTSTQASVINALSSSKIIISRTTVKGEIGGQIINDFRSFGVVVPTWLTPEEIKNKTASAEETFKLNQFLTTFALSFGNGPTDDVLFKNPNDITLSQASYAVYDPRSQDSLKKISQNIDILRKNTELIDQAIQQSAFQGTKSELAKLTISEIFRRLAGDAAYILGRILEAGINGYSLNSDIRNSPGNGDLIGKSYPLVFKSDDQNGSELPATTEFFGNDVGVDSNEMQFVQEFIQAVSEGIAENQDFEESGTTGEVDSKLKTRVNNLEMLQQNPYLSDYKNIANNVLMRSAIIGYFTRSSDPNEPGDYNSATNIDNDSQGEISKLAIKDIENLSIEKLTSLTENDLGSLKRFCTFFTTLFTPAGELNEEAVRGNAQSTFGLLQSSPTQKLSEELLDFRVQINSTDITTVGDYFFGTKNSDGTRDKITGEISSIISSSNPDMARSSSFLNYGISRRFYNNNLPWVFSDTTTNKYSMILFRGQDAVNTTSVQSAPTDSEFAGLSSDEKNKVRLGDFGQKEMRGVIQINSFTNTIDGKPVESEAVQVLQDYLNVDRVYEYNKIKQDPIGAVEIVNSTINNFEPTYEVDRRLFLTTYNLIGNDIIHNNVELVSESQQETDEQLPASNLSYTVYTHTFDNSNFEGIAWGLFLLEGIDNTGPGMGQRVALYSMCKTILDKIVSFEIKKSNVISDVLSKAAEEQNSIYKQFHNIFHKWNALAFDDISTYDRSGRNNFCGIVKQGTNLATKLEEDYSGTHVNSSTGDEYPNNSAFIYEYPLNATNSNSSDFVDVSQSIINIDPLYTPDGNTTVLNMIQQICTKNNFMFIPIPGNGDYKNISEIYSPNPVASRFEIRNYFHVLFMPTPESRVYSNDNITPKGLEKRIDPEKFTAQAFGVEFGSIDNQIVKKLDVILDVGKSTAEEIVNLQRLATKENKNKVVTKDCSTLPILEGRSYTATIDMLGNAQIFPMQFFYIKKSPLFSGLYQVMKVKHSITPNDMTTTMEGIRLAFSPGTGYGGIPPITIKSLSKVSVLSSPNAQLGTSNDNVTSNITSQNPLSNLVAGVQTLQDSRIPNGYISRYITYNQSRNSRYIATTGNQNIPNDLQLENMKYVAQNIFDKVADKFGKNNISLNSFFRNTIINAAAGGSMTSHHLDGSAIDIGSTNPHITNSQIYFYIKNNLPYTELIWEYGDDNNPRWVHVALIRGRENVKERLRIGRNGLLPPK